MNHSSAIPQYELYDSTGQLVRFDFMQWNIKNQNYDSEKPHRHNFNEVLVFYKGGGTHEIDFTTYKATNHSIHFVASDNVHLVLRSKDSSGCSLLFANDYFSKELVERLPFSKTNPVLRLNKPEFNMIRKLVDSIKTEYSNKLSGYEAIIQAHMNAFMQHLLRIYHFQHPEAKEKSTHPLLVIHFMDLLKQYYINHYNVEQYADKLNISPKHLISLCKNHTGKTPMRHIREYTIAEAKKLLYHSKLSVKEIAFQLNFDDPSNFSKYFKVATRYSPLEYREGIR